MSATAWPIMLPNQAEFAAALLDPHRPCPPGLHTWNGADPAKRFAVYRNNVIISLVDALADGFPVVAQLVGDEFFRAMAAVFVRHAPPCSRILARYGEGFADFIAKFDPAAGLPYLADVAALEMARVQAFHAADAPALDAEGARLALSCAERAGELVLALHPSVRVLRSEFALASLWAAHQCEGEVDLGGIEIDAPEAAGVLRQGIEVLVLPLTHAGHDFVAALRQGRPLGDAAAAALAVDPSFDLGACLALLLGHGAVVSIQLPGSQAP